MDAALTLSNGLLPLQQALEDWLQEPTQPELLVSSWEEWSFLLHHERTRAPVLDVLCRLQADGVIISLEKGHFLFKDTDFDVCLDALVAGNAPDKLVSLVLGVLRQGSDLMPQRLQRKLEFAVAHSCFVRLREEDSLLALELLVVIVSRWTVDSCYCSNQEWQDVLRRLTTLLPVGEECPAARILAALSRDLRPAWVAAWVLDALADFACGVCGQRRLAVLQAIARTLGYRAAMDSYFLGRSDFLLHPLTCPTCGQHEALKNLSMVIMAKGGLTCKLILQSEDRALCLQYLDQASGPSVRAPLEVVASLVRNTTDMPFSESRAILTVCLQQCVALGGWTSNFQDRSHCAQLLRWIFRELANNPRHAVQLVKSKLNLILI